MPMRRHNRGSWCGQRSCKRRLRWGACGKVLAYRNEHLPSVSPLSVGNKTPGGQNLSQHKYSKNSLVHSHASKHFFRVGFFKEKRSSWNESLCLQSCGVHSDELGKVLRLLGLKKKRLVNLLPLLEFITWSLLKEDSMVRNYNLQKNVCVCHIILFKNQVLQKAKMKLKLWQVNWIQRYTFKIW